MLHGKTGKLVGLVFLCAVMLNAISSYAEDNLLSNPGFEGKTKGWNLWGMDQPLVSTDAHTGKNSLQAHDIQGGYSSGAYQWFKIEPGATYLFEGWVKAEALGSEAWIEFQWFDENNAIQIGDTVTSRGSEIITGSKDWTRLEIKVTAPPMAKVARVAFKVEGAKGFAYFDDAKVTIIK